MENLKWIGTCARLPISLSRRTSVAWQTIRYQIHCSQWPQFLVKNTFTCCLTIFHGACKGTGTCLEHSPMEKKARMNPIHCCWLWGGLPSRFHERSSWMDLVLLGQQPKKNKGWGKKGEREGYVSNQQQLPENPPFNWRLLEITLCIAAFKLSICKAKGAQQTLASGMECKRELNWKRGWMFSLYMGDTTPDCGEWRKNGCSDTNEY